MKSTGKTFTCAYVLCVCVCVCVCVYVMFCVVLYVICYVVCYVMCSVKCCAMHCVRVKSLSRPLLVHCCISSVASGLVKGKS